MQRLSRGGSWLLKHNSPAGLSSFAAGVFVLSWMHQAAARFGTSKQSITAFLTLSLLAYLLAQVLHSRFPATSNSRGRLLDIGLSLALAVGAIFSPTLLAGGWATAVAVSSQWPSGFEQLYALAAGASVSFLPMFVVAFWQCRRCADAASLSRRVLQIAGGASFAIFVLAPKWGVHATLLFAAICNVLLIVWNLKRLATATATATNNANNAINAINAISAISDSALEVPSLSIEASEPGRSADWVARIGVVFVCGFAFVCWQRYVDQLLLQGSWVTSVEWIALCGFAALGIRFGKSKRLRNVDFWAAAFGVLWLGLFGKAVDVALDVSSYVGNVGMAAAIRGTTIAVIVAPLGLAIGVQLASLGVGSPARRVAGPIFVFGVLTGTWLIATQPTAVFLIVISLTLIACGVCRVATIRPFAIELRRPGFVAAVVAAVIACCLIPAAFSRYEPQRSAKLLFDTGVFMANRYEKNADILEHLDEARCIATAESDNGTLTLWRMRGTQLQLRESGLPTSAVSTQSEICPSPTSETLRAIIPLTLAERPSRVVIVRSGTGTALRTSLLFPIEHIECIEPDKRAFEFVIDHVYGPAASSPLNDDRVRVHHCDPQLALATMVEPCDVVLLDAGQFCVGSAASEITREFLMTAAECLRQNGIAAMRFQYADFGPGAVKLFVETWNSVFAKAGAIETAPGEWLLFGSNGDRYLIPADLVQRLHKNHVRTALAQLGWDWATPLNLAVYTKADFEAAFEGSPTVVNTATNVRLTSWLPWEVMRWGSKYDEVIGRLGNHGQKLQTLVQDGDHKEVEHRMAELNLQRDIINDHPDSYWQYRNRVKSRLKESPRAELIQVKGEKPVHKLHHEDKNRLEYFTQLGKVAQMKKPDAESLLSVYRFAEPYDPLLTFFMHEEVAQLASRNREEVANVELPLRLYRVHFTSPQDRSIRNITKAIDILCDYPQCVDSPAIRADHLDALLQTLHQRWQNRGDVSPSSSPIVMTEIEMSISAAEKAFDVLEQSCDARQMTKESWTSRQKSLEKSLVRPLRTYRTMLLRHSGS